MPAQEQGLGLAEELHDSNMIGSSRGGLAAQEIQHLALSTALSLCLTIAWQLQSHHPSTHVVQHIQGTINQQVSRLDRKPHNP